MYHITHNILIKYILAYLLSVTLVGLAALCRVSLYLCVAASVCAHNQKLLFLSIVVPEMF